MSKIKKDPKKFSDLSKKRQDKLVKFFQCEFLLTKKQATKDCRRLSGKDFGLHLDACENGYMY
jgi:hypothetical protein